MPEIGYFLSSEELDPRAIVRFAAAGEQAGFGSLFVSDHFHPWTDAQGESGFVWSVLGAIAATTELRLMTGVTCPIERIHPAVLAQATATTQLLAEGRFRFGVGTGENLNEHILGHRWPPAATRLAMLDEAIGIIRRLWEGSQVTHHGEFFCVENARLYSLPDTPPPVLVSAFGPEAAWLAARLGDGLVCTQPDGAVLRHFRDDGGSGTAVGATKVCWAEDEASARKAAHQLWSTEMLPGQLNQELPLPLHFEQATELVTEDMVAEKIPCGPDPERHVAALRPYLEAGYDELYVSQIGQDQAGFLDFFAKEVRPRLGL